MPSEVVIIGGNFAAVTAAQAVLGMRTIRNFHVTLISASEQCYFNVSAPRAVVEPHMLKDSKKPVFFPLKDIFEPQSKSIEIINATVTSVDLDARSVSFKGIDNEISITYYDTLIFASGARSSHPAFKLHGTHTDVIQASEDLSLAIDSAQTIAIGGGGATAVETAGEIAGKYGPKSGKQITVYAGSGLLDGYGNMGSSAKSKLKSLGVSVVNAKVESSSSTPNGAFEIKIAGQSALQPVDLYIPLVGTTPNTEFIKQSKVLDKKGYIVTDKYFRVDGYNSVYAVGDCVSGTPGTLMDLSEAQKRVITATLTHDLVTRSHPAFPYSPASSLTMLVPISKKGGVGLIKGWHAPGFAVKNIKSSDFLVSKAPSFFTK